MNDTPADPNAGAPAPGAADSAAGQQISLMVHGQYLKDLSFEVPLGAKTFMRAQSGAPNVSVNVDVKVDTLGAEVFEVSLSFEVTGRSEDKTVFLLELTYCGIVQVKAPADQMQPLLLIEVPRLLFPFARGLISDATRDGGFPPVLIQPIDFVGLFRAQAQRNAEASETA